MKKHLANITIILLFIWAALPLFSQSSATTVRASIDSSTAYVGQPVHYTIKISGENKTERPTLKNFRGFRIEEAGQSTSVQAYRMNGSSTKLVVSEFTWLLYPEHTGNIPIPSLSFEVDGETVITAKGVLKVIEPAPLEGYHLFLQAEGENVFPGLPVRISLKWLFSSQVSQPDFTLPFLEQSNLDVKSLPAPSVQSNDIYQFSINGETVYATQSSEIYKGEQYASLTIEWDVYPRETGVLELDPAILSFKRGVGRDGWGNIDYENAVIPSNSLSLKVMELPENLKKAPGGLLISKDKLDVKIELDQQRVYPGDPITVKMKLSNLMQADMTDFQGFQEFPELQKQFRIDNASLLSYEEEGSLIIKQTVRVTDPEAGAFPALSFLYYNQLSGKTEEIRSEALNMDIIPIEPGMGSAISNGVKNSESSEKNDTSVSKLSLYHNESLEHIREPFLRSFPFALFLILPPLLYLLIVLFQYFRSGKSTRFFLSLLQKEDSYSLLKGRIKELRHDYSSDRIRDFSEYLRQWIQKEYDFDQVSSNQELYAFLVDRGMDQNSAANIRELFEKMDEFCWSDAGEMDAEFSADFMEKLSSLKPDDFYCKPGRKTS